MREQQIRPLEFKSENSMHTRLTINFKYTPYRTPSSRTVRIRSFVLYFRQLTSNGTLLFGKNKLRPIFFRYICKLRAVFLEI
jgi:hypothetical protein